MKTPLFRLAAPAVLVLLAALAAPAWEHHPLFTGPALSILPEVAKAAPVAAEPLEDFLLAVEAELAEVLAAEEAWARENLPLYAPRPDALAFAPGSARTIRERFLQAVRVNPEMMTPLYVFSLKGMAAHAGRKLDASEVSVLEDLSALDPFEFTGLAPGAPVAPLDVVATSSNEPDYGLDVGLFEDNGTPAGRAYGFGVQPFGNPNLDFGSQAPFHMGYYHEAGIVFAFASFLKVSYPEHRIHLYKTLSEFAFRTGHPYWGWRFMGWGLHYLADLSQPYHATVLPGVSVMRMLWINLLDILGWSGPKDDAVQLVSNQHLIMEVWQGIEMVRAWRAGDMGHPLIRAVTAPVSAPDYTDAAPRAMVARRAFARAKSTCALLLAYLPAAFVSDPSVEVMDRPERHEVVEAVVARHGPEAAAEINALEAGLLSSFAAHGRSYARAILTAAG